MLLEREQDLRWRKLVTGLCRVFDTFSLFELNTKRKNVTLDVRSEHHDIHHAFVKDTDIAKDI